MGTGRARLDTGFGILATRLPSRPVVLALCQLMVAVSLTISRASFSAAVLICIAL